MRKRDVEKKWIEEEGERYKYMCIYMRVRKIERYERNFCWPELKKHCPTSPPIVRSTFSEACCEHKKKENPTLGSDVAVVDGGWWWWRWRKEEGCIMFKTCLFKYHDRGGITIGRYRRRRGDSEDRRPTDRDWRYRRTELVAILDKWKRERERQNEKEKHFTLNAW